MPSWTFQEWGRRVVMQDIAENQPDAGLERAFRFVEERTAA
jgi:hypothetical protein